MAQFNSFLAIICFSSSSVNAKKKFRGVLHLLHMRVIFYLASWKVVLDFTWLLNLVYLADTSMEFGDKPLGCDSVFFCHMAKQGLYEFLRTLHKLTNQDK